MEIFYITLDQAKSIHEKTIRYSGGGVYESFDLGRLDSVLENMAVLQNGTRREHPEAYPFLYRMKFV